mgnify:CR=1 FL=1
MRVSHDYQRKLQDNQRMASQLGDYEDKMTTLGKEIERCNIVIGKLNDELR